MPIKVLDRRMYTYRRLNVMRWWQRGKYHKKSHQYLRPSLSIEHLLPRTNLTVRHPLFDYVPLLVHPKPKRREYLRGPRGTGFLYISNDILAQNIMPSHINHFGCPISLVPPSSSYHLVSQLQNSDVIDFNPRDGAKRFEFWELSISARLGLGEAVCLAMEQGLPQILRNIRRLSALLRNVLEDEIPSVRIHHKESTTCGIVTFYCRDVDARSV